MLLEIIGGGVLVCLIWYFIFKRDKKLEGVPPGPIRLPLLGNIIELALTQKGKTPSALFHDLNKKYGPITFMQLGVNYQVVTEDMKFIKEILSSEAWVDRFFDEFVAHRSFGKHLGVLMVGGGVWKEMRRFSIRTLRDFGFGKQKSMEETIQEEIVELMDALGKTIDSDDKGQSIIRMKQYFTVAVLNSLWSMIAGTRFCHDDEKMLQLVGRIDQVIKSTAVGGSLTTLMTSFPILNRILPKDKKRMELYASMHLFFQDILDERRAEGHYKVEQRDFIDVFLMEIDRHKELKSEPNYYTDEQFIIVTMDLFLAGSETTSNTMEFAILYMILNPEVQRKVQGEIDTIVGRNRLPSYEDKPKMPYTEATLLEIQRMANVIPTIIRSATQDTTLGKYRIPKGTIAVLNTYGMHMEENNWTNPQEFSPQRFLDKDMNVVNSNNILPFGLGKRVCLGQVLAQASLFTFFTAFLQRFTFEASSTHGELTVKPVAGFTLSPASYHALVKYRDVK